MPRRKEIFDYEKLVREYVTLDQRIAVLENMCVSHILKYKNVIYSKRKKDTIVITNELQGLFFHLGNLLKEQAATTAPSKYDYFAKYNPDKYSDNVKLRNMKASRTAGYIIYGGFVDLDRDVNFNHKDDYRSIILDVLKNNLFHVWKNRYYKIYGSGNNLDVKYIGLDEYIKANLSAYSDEHRTNEYHITKKKDALLTILDSTYVNVKKLWRIDINKVERSFLNYLFNYKEFSVFKDMRPFMRLRYDNFFEHYEYHGFQIFFLFHDILFSLFFIITQDVEYYLPTRRGNQLIYIDGDGTRYYLSETVKLLRRNLNEAKEYVVDYLEEVDNKLLMIDSLVEAHKHHSKYADDNIVFEKLETKLKLNDIFFKMMLEKLSKERIIENISQKDWFQAVFKDTVYHKQTCLFSSLNYINNLTDLKRGLEVCLQVVGRQMRKIDYQNTKADERIVERQSALGISNAIRLWQEENIEEVRIEVEKKRKELEEIKLQQKIWVAKKMKEIDERIEQKRVFMEERKKALEEKKKRIQERKLILEQKKKLKEQKPKKVKPIIFTPEEEKEYQIKKIKYYQEFLEHEEADRKKELRAQQRIQLKERRLERKKLREIKSKERQEKIILRQKRKADKLKMQEQKDQVKDQKLLEKLEEEKKREQKRQFREDKFKAAQQKREEREQLRQEKLEEKQRKKDKKNNKGSNSSNWN